MRIRAILHWHGPCEGTQGTQRRVNATCAPRRTQDCGLLPEHRWKGLVAKIYSKEFHIRAQIAGYVSLALLLAFPTSGCVDSGQESGATRVQPRDLVTGPDSVVLRLALQAATNARAQGLGLRPILTIIDYSLPSVSRRLWVLDSQTEEVLFHELVSHGKGSGEVEAETFSNVPESQASSLGLFETGETYEGKHGYSLRLKGLEEGFNHNAAQRSIVIHGAWYVSDSFANKHGRVGRSWGCPALDKTVNRALIDAIKDGSLVFVYYPDQEWLAQSTFLSD